MARFILQREITQTIQEQVGVTALDIHDALDLAMNEHFDIRLARNPVDPANDEPWDLLMQLDDNDSWPAKHESITHQEKVDLAILACRQLTSAYADALQNGGSVDWEDVDEAHALALRALS